ncbi:UPF0160 protein MYG1, mitochondrial [Hypsibius exemplaris]|uniref:UPF0160 protein MYG1, mitochondrial n=1 Tax=Hypsibius exemplaris TaxID=2072580 RepID=A0A1W0X7A7_HYPEX|nr:UPF0160 protein MYG1, mitochondrial [Hypsibius exemplaris]
MMMEKNEDEERVASWSSSSTCLFIADSHSADRNVAGRSRVSPPAQQPPHPPPEQQDKKMRREIANSNERRRMMCINNGFVSLQMILPKHYMKRGEKMSKAAVLQSTVDYISKLVMDNQKLQKKNQLLSDKFGPGIQDDDDCTEEGMPVSEHDSDQTVSSAKDLVSMVQHWREKYTRERCLRAQAIEEFRRLVSDPQYCCTQGCSKRQQYIAALHRRSKSPTPDNDDDFMGPVSQSEEQQQQHQMPVIVKRDISNQFPEATPCNERREAPIIVFRDPVPPPVLCESASAVPLKRKSSCSSALNYLSAPQPEPMMQEEAKMNKFSGFDILYQAIISSEGHVDGNRSDSGCSEETFDSNEPPKKRQKQQKNKQQPVVVVSTLSPPANMERDDGGMRIKSSSPLLPSGISIVFVICQHIVTGAIVAGLFFPLVSRSVLLLPSSLCRGSRNLGAMISNGSNKAYRIATHNGVFHADEALACFMLKQLPEYHNATIVRTRDPEIYNKCDVVVDVGGVFDASMFRFDHHQRGFQDTLNSLQPDKPWTIKLSSAGLIYCHFGRRVIAQILGVDVLEERRIIDLIYDKVYDSFIQEMDAIDNGIAQNDKPTLYQINTGLSNRVKRLNPAWNDKDKSTDARFEEAIKLTGSELVSKIDFYKNAWLPARTLVEQAIHNRHQVDPSGEIVRFTVGGCPWQDHVFQIERERQLEPNIKFAIYEDDNGQWRVQAVPVSQGSFASRLPLPEAWRGLNTDVLSGISGIPGCVFCHHSGFIGGNSSYEGALQMARFTLQMAAASITPADHQEVKNL